MAETPPRQNKKNKKDRTRKKGHSDDALYNQQELKNSDFRSYTQHDTDSEQGDTGIGLTEVAAGMLSSTASMLLAPLEAMGQIPTLAVTNAIQGITRATSGLSFQQLSLHNMIFDAVKRTLEFRRGIFSALPSTNADNFNSLDADEGLVGIDEDSDDPDMKREAPSVSSKRSSLYGDIFREKRRSGLFSQSGLRGENSAFDTTLKHTSDLQSALDLLHLIQDPQELSENIEQLRLEKEVAKIRLTALDRGVTQANDIIGQISDRLKQLESQKDSLLLQIEDICASKKKVVERVDCINSKISQFENSNVNERENLVEKPEFDQPNPQISIEAIEDVQNVESVESAKVEKAEEQDKPTREDEPDLNSTTPNPTSSKQPSMPPKAAFQDWQAHESTVTSLFQDRKGPLLATASEGQIKLWGIDECSGLYTFRSELNSNQGTIHCLKIVDGILATGGNDHQVHIWNTHSLNLATEPTLLAVEPFDIEPGSPLLAPVSPSSIPSLSPRPASPVLAPHPAIVLKGHTGLIRCLDMDEKSVISGSMDGTMRHWDVENGKLITSFNPLWTMNDTLLKDYRVRYWDVLAGRGPHAEGLGSTVGALQFRSWALCSGTADGIIRLWDIRSGQSHRSFTGHTGPVTALQFDSTHLVSGSLDHTVRIWDLRAGKVMETVKLPSGITSVQMDSQRVVASYDSKLIEVYERRTFQRRQLRGHSYSTWCLQLDDNRRLLSGDQSGRVRLSTL